VEVQEPSDIVTEPRELAHAEVGREMDLQQQALDAGNAALGETTLVDAVPMPRSGLREAATAAVAAWEAQDGLEAVLTALKAALWPAVPYPGPLAPLASPVRAPSRRRC
jgi:hypothetical protein